MITVSGENQSEVERAVAQLRRWLGGHVKAMSWRETGELSARCAVGRALSLELPDTIQLGRLVVELDANLPPTCMVTGDGQAILCLRCGAWSHNAGDVANLYCARCKVFHRDLPREP